MLVPFASRTQPIPTVIMYRLLPMYIAGYSMFDSELQHVYSRFTAC